MSLSSCFRFLILWFSYFYYFFSFSLLCPAFPVLLSCLFCFVSFYYLFLSPFFVCEWSLIRCSIFIIFLFCSLLLPPSPSHYIYRFYLGLLLSCSSHCVYSKYRNFPYFELSSSLLYYNRFLLTVPSHFSLYRNVLSPSFSVWFLLFSFWFALYIYILYCDYDKSHKSSYLVWRCRDQVALSMFE